MSNPQPAYWRQPLTLPAPRGGNGRTTNEDPSALYLIADQGPSAPPSLELLAIRG